jgi:hypothetical protein
MRLNVKAFALTFGIIWGLGLFILTWWIIADQITSPPQSCLRNSCQGSISI